MEQLPHKCLKDMWAAGNYPQVQAPEGSSELWKLLSSSPRHQLPPPACSPCWWQTLWSSLPGRVGSAINGNKALFLTDCLSSFHFLDHLLAFFPSFIWIPRFRIVDPGGMNPIFFPSLRCAADVPLEGSGKRSRWKIKQITSWKMSKPGPFHSQQTWWFCRYKKGSLHAELPKDWYVGLRHMLL